MVSGSQKPKHRQPGVSTSRYRIAQQRDGLPRFAVVELSAGPAQGESVVVAGYDEGRFSWRELEVACFAGIAYVLARVPGWWAVTVHEIKGHPLDTTPATVGYAAIRAMCEATGHALPADELARLESFALGRSSSIDAIPDFEALWEDE
ncbi:MAG: hypothetical protein FWF02_06070 [Micrococcales bacterium]|nr:hypothetical protein [Micrococcales bacterium]MCL2667257.1 hypothetical protein [Micrococcales bacterium]